MPLDRQREADSNTYSHRGTAKHTHREFQNLLTSTGTDTNYVPGDVTHTEYFSAAVNIQMAFKMWL